MPSTPPPTPMFLSVLFCFFPNCVCEGAFLGVVPHEATPPQLKNPLRISQSALFLAALKITRSLGVKEFASFHPSLCNYLSEEIQLTNK